MPRLISIVLVFVMLITIPMNAFASDGQEEQSDEISYEPYTEMEFPDFALDLRRAETIFFGSLPITFAASSLAVSALDSVLSADLPNNGLSLGLTIGLSAGIAIIDYVLGLNEGENVEQ